MVPVTSTCNSRDLIILLCHLSIVAAFTEEARWFKTKLDYDTTLESKLFFNHMIGYSNECRRMSFRHFCFRLDPA